MEDCEIRKEIQEPKIIGMQLDLSFTKLQKESFIVSNM